MKAQIKSIITLVCICAVVAVMLAVTNYITAPIIEQNQNAAANEALLEVMPDGKGFELMDISSFELPATVTEVYKEQGGGYVIKLTTSGYGAGMVIMCGVRADETVSGAVCLSSNETLGKEKTYGESFTGKDLAGVEAVETISGATMTTTAYRNAVKDAINTVKVLKGGSVDFRTEEEILAENLANALPTANGEFEKLFIVEVIEGIDAIYKANNGAGYVCVVGEQFIATDAEGKVIGEVDSSVAASIEAEMAKIAASKLNEIDLSTLADAPHWLENATVTESGNYVVVVKGAGYGINGGNQYHPASGEYIYVKVSLTPDGKIIDCYTFSQEESKGIGDACANEKFYGQFDGKTEDDYNNIDAISGATITTEGYLQAIGRAFEAVKLLEGGATNE